MSLDVPCRAAPRRDNEDTAAVTRREEGDFTRHRKLKVVVKNAFPAIRLEYRERSFGRNLANLHAIVICCWIHTHFLRKIGRNFLNLSLT